MAAGQYSFDALLEFMDWMIQKGMVNKQTGSSWKTASQKVLETLDPSETEDLRNLDRESAFARFQNINRSKYTPDSLKVYRNRFSAAVDNFLEHADNPSGYRPSVGARRPSNGSNVSRAAKGKKQTKSSALSPSKQLVPVDPHVGSIEASLTLPIPLRPGVLVKIFGLPADLSDEEAKKICAVVTAYAVQK